MAVASTLGLFAFFPNPNPYKVTLQLPRHRLDRPPVAGIISQSHALSALGSSAVLALPFVLDTQAAWAVDGKLGILEGRALSLIHPVAMSGLFFYAIWAGYLGLKWRRVRTIQDEINELKERIAADAEGGDEAVAAGSAASMVEARIQKLTEVRKELIKGSYRDRHFNAASILLIFGVLGAASGGINTCFRTGKLFPGPHLYAGAAIPALWTASAAMVPEMKKGNDTARNLHMALNSLSILLFIAQIPTGIDIVLKVFESTKWP